MMTHLCRVCTHIYTYINNPWLGFSSRTSTTVYEYTRVSDTSFHADRIISLKLDAVESGGRGGEGRGGEGIGLESRCGVFLRAIRCSLHV